MTSKAGKKNRSEFTKNYKATIWDIFLLSDWLIKNKTADGARVSGHLVQHFTRKAFCAKDKARGVCRVLWLSF